MLCEWTGKQGTCIQGLDVQEHWFFEEQSLPWWKLPSSRHIHRRGSTGTQEQQAQQGAAHLPRWKMPWIKPQSTQVSPSPVCLPAHPCHTLLWPHKSHKTLFRKCWTQGILIFSGCISKEELWMATNCSYYANETAHLEIADVALLKMQELLVWKVQFNKPSLLKTLKTQNTESL